jgi:phage-related protein
MATFSFTMTSAEVDAVKGTSGAATFEAVADRGLSRQAQQRILTAKFGDGYEQRVRDGVNTKTENFNISFNNRSADEINLIAGYLDNKAALSFELVITDTFSNGSLTTSTIDVVCDTYQIQYGHTDYHSLTTTLRRVYEP